MKYLLDSNIIIYLSKETLPIEKVFQNSCEYFISIITFMEVLGHSFVSEVEEEKVKSLISKLNIIYVDQPIALEVVQIRKDKKMKLPDAIIAATAIVKNMSLMTYNIDDFKNIEKLQIINPED
ncbi:MAG: type II toxin-antitoxin system VapC family toxin [Leptospiraceae bacterium]|nr:type II toxin-antitoxin system VapC family toxin [Leptospiraceae bacterium]